MCGIVGYIGFRDAHEVLIKGLQRLEYRGYDSAGIALVDNNNKFKLFKSTGKVQNLQDILAQRDNEGSFGIAHTRWATHGIPNDANAHPHVSCSGELALVHNGIIENYRILKDLLIENGYTFKSDTDSEVLVNFIEFIRKTQDCTVLEAVRRALKKVVGAYAITVIDTSNPNEIIAVRKSSPMVIGINENEFFIASDATAIIEYTNNFVYVKDDEIAIIKRGCELKLTTLNNESVDFDIQHLELSISQLEKGGYPYFMLKEIFEQPKTIQDCLSGRINNDSVLISGIVQNKDKFINAKRIIFVACGTSWHASLIGEHLIETLCRIPVEVEYASEFRYRNPIINKNDIVIAVSQSGETADTLAAIDLAKKAGAFVYGICNVVGSSIARNTDSGTYIHVGPEIGVASTKAFTGQVTLMTLIAMSIAKYRNTIDEDLYKELIGGLNDLPNKIAEVLEKNECICDLAKIFTYARNFIYLGRGFNFATALEGALKLKEISYIHAEGYPAAEMKHGPIALIDKDMPIVVIATQNDSIYEKTISNIEEIKARSGRIISVITEGDEQVRNLSDYYVEIPEVHEYLMPIIASIPLQLLAYHVAVYKGCNVDQPRNLAKSVTVE